MAGKFTNFLEDVMSIGVTAGSKGIQQGGTSIATAAAEKVGWVSKNTKGKKFGGPSIGNSFSARKRGLDDMSQYDPKASYNTQVHRGGPMNSKQKNNSPQLNSPASKGAGLNRITDSTHSGSCSNSGSSQPTGLKGQSACSLLFPEEPMKPHEEARDLEESTREGSKIEEKFKW